MLVARSSSKRPPGRSRQSGRVNAPERRREDVRDGYDLDIALVAKPWPRAVRRCTSLAPSALAGWQSPLHDIPQLPGGQRGQVIGGCQPNRVQRRGPGSAAGLQRVRPGRDQLGLATAVKGRTGQPISAARRVPLLSTTDQVASDLRGYRHIQGRERDGGRRRCTGCSLTGKELGPR